MSAEEFRPITNRRVLIVEDETRLRDMLTRALKDMDFLPHPVGTAEQAIASLETSEIDILLSDLNLPGMSGLDLCRLVRDNWPRMQVIILTGYGDLETAKQAIRLDVVDFLTKPCSLSDLEVSLDRALRRQMNHIIPHRITAHDFGEDGDVPEDSQIPRTLRELERDHILSALDRKEGNRSATAFELGISERTLYYRLKIYQEQGFRVPRSTASDP